ncbi:MAG: PAS domain S-box protein [bacterium]
MRAPPPTARKTFKEKSPASSLKKNRKGRPPLPENTLNHTKNPLFRSMLNHITDGIVIVDEKGHFLFFNPVAEEIMGIGRVDASPSQWTEKYGLFLKDKKTPYPPEKLPLARAMRGEEVRNEEIYVLNSRRPEGLWIRVQASPLTNEKDHPRGAIAVFQNITDQKNAEAEIRYLHENLEHRIFQRSQELTRLKDQIIRQQSALLALGKMQDNDLETSLKRITEIDANTLNVERVSIWLYNPARTEIVCENLYRKSARIHEKELRLKASDYPRYFKSLEESLLIAANNAQTDPRTREFTENYLKPLQIRSMMDVPIRREGKLLGILCHEHVGLPREWTPEEQDFATSLADRISLSIETYKRKKAEQETEKSLSLLQATLESTADGILVVDSDGKWTSFNLKFLEMWRIPASITRSRDDEAALNFVLDQLSNPEDFLKKVRELYDHPESLSYDLVEFKDGRIFERFSQPQHIGKKSLGRVWSFRDVTQRRKAEEALKKSESRLRLLIQQIPAILWTTDRDLIINSSAGAGLSAVNLKPEQFIGKSLYESVGTNDPDFLPIKAHLKALQGESMNYELPWLGRIYNTSVEPLRDLEDHIVGAIGLALDVTETKKAEENLRKKTRELERSNRELEQFAYVASHDLQEPLHKIIAFADRLKNYQDASLDEKGLHYLDRMQNASLRMKQLIHDLLQFARVTTRGNPFQRVPLEEVVQEVLNDLDLRLSEGKATVKIGPLPHVNADRLQMRQLFQNLISNAIKFRKKEESPEVFIEGEDLKDGFVEIRVRDNGVGFDAQYLDRIFLPFQRLHGRSDYEGSGMGLAICQKIIARHGGQITATSTPGEGTVFSVRLPT